jgi:hypothetical protein
LSSNISYSKDNPLKIFKKEILGGDAKKHMKQSLRQSKPLKKILSVVKDQNDKAVNIQLDVKTKGHTKDWNRLGERNQRWEFDTQNKYALKINETVYGTYTFKLKDESNLGGSIFQSVGTDKTGSPMLPSQQIQYWDDGQVVWKTNIIDEVFYFCDDIENSNFQKTDYTFYLGTKNSFKEYRTISFKMVPSDTEKGETIVWRDDKKVMEAYGTNMSVGHGIGFKIGLYRWLEQKSLKGIGSTSLSIKNFSYSDKCEEILDSMKCSYKSSSRNSTTTLKYTTKKRRDKEHGKICKTVKGKVSPKEIKFSEPENNEKFMVIVKNKKNPKYMIKIKGPTKEEASKKGLKNCKQKNPNLASDCYVHYSTIVNDFNS